jgi:steroid delta-isomerase-like uncharacterized protein
LPDTSRLPFSIPVNFRLADSPTTITKMCRKGLESLLELNMAANMVEIFDLLTELWNTGKPELAVQLYSEQAVRSDPNQSQPTRGPQQIAEYIAEVRRAFPDFKLEIKQRIGEADQVSSEWTCTGTHRDAFLGIPATGRRVEMNGVTLNRFADDQIVEERVYFDRLSLLQQLGVAPGLTDAAAKTASTRQ